jgi:hypothetical protein
MVKHVLVAVSASTLLAGAARAASVETDLAGVNGLAQVDKIAWTDSKGLPREADFAKGLAGNAAAAGYITRLVWQADAATTVTSNEPDVNDERSGLGIACDWHEVFKSFGKSAATSVKTSIPLRGAHHVIYRVEMKMLGVSSVQLDPTIDWLFADGVDSVVYAITFHVNPAESSAYPPSEPRTPYARFDFDGDGSAGEGISGMRYGDDKVFVSSDMKAFTYGGANTVPFTHEWKTTPDREWGFVQTQTFAQQKAGYDAADFEPTSGTLTGSFDQSNPWQLGYWMNGVSTPPWSGDEMSWRKKCNSEFDTSSSYSVVIVVGTKSAAGVDTLVKELEAVHGGKVTLTATSGSVVTSGPEGCGSTKAFTYDPPGFNHVYRTWDLDHGASSTDFSLAVTSGAVHNPVFAIHGYGSAPGQVSLGGKALTSGVDYAASVDATGTLFLTVMGDLSGTSTISVSGAGTSDDGGFAPPVSDAAPKTDAKGAGGGAGGPATGTGGTAGTAGTVSTPSAADAGDEAAPNADTGGCSCRLGASGGGSMTTTLLGILALLRLVRPRPSIANVRRVGTCSTDPPRGGARPRAAGRSAR